MTPEQFSQSLSPDPRATAIVSRLRMRIDGMTCASCERHVAQALRDAGATDPIADFRRGEVQFSAPLSVESQVFTTAVAQTGYRPGELESVTSERAFTRTNGRGRGDRYDLAIVGSGGAAFAAAITAVDRGARVVMIEQGTLGGTCVNVGCVPSKTQLRAGELFWHAGHQPFPGIRTSADDVDLATLVDAKHELVASLRKEKYADLVDEYGWELVGGTATFEGEQTLRADGHAISADGFVVATGARPAVPAIDGLQNVEYLTSTSLPYSGPQTSAEWIEEAPTVGGRVATLANYGLTTFDPGTVNGVNPQLTAAESGVIFQRKAQVSTPSSPDSDTDGFSVEYGSAAPTPLAS